MHFPSSCHHLSFIATNWAPICIGRSNHACLSEFQAWNLLGTHFSLAPTFNRKQYYSKRLSLLLPLSNCIWIGIRENGGSRAIKRVVHFPRLSFHNLMANLCLFVCLCLRHVWHLVLSILALHSFVHFCALSTTTVTSVREGNLELQIELLVERKKSCLASMCPPQSICGRVSLSLKICPSL